MNEEIEFILDSAKEGMNSALGTPSERITHH